MRISWARALAGTALAICMATPVAAWAGPQSASGEKDAAGQDTPGASGEDSAYPPIRSEEHTSELQSLMRISYAVFCLKKKKKKHTTNKTCKVLNEYCNKRLRTDK